MNQKFDVIVLGAGNAGQVVAKRARNAGKTVLVVESREVGGTCPLRGCVPKKVLVAAAETLHKIQLAGHHHIQIGPAKLNWEKLIERKQTFVEGVPQAFEQGLKKAGIEVVHGRAKFVDSHSIEVNGQVFSAEKILISTGSKPRQLPIPGFEFAVTSDEILDMKKQPKSLIFIGAGFIAMEFTHVFARAGTEVTILEIASRPLLKYDADLVAALTKETENLGVKIVTSAQVQSIEKIDRGFLIKYIHDNQTKSVTADVVANGTGRVADIDDLNLEAAGVARDKQGILVDEYLRSTTNPDIFVAGDALATSPQLSPVASYEGKIVAHNLLNDELIRPDYRAIPSVVFTVPALASVGLTEEAARVKGLKFQVKLNDMKEWRSSKSYAETAAMAKVLIEEESQNILGAHILGHAAEEIIHLFAFAIKYDLTAIDLREFIYAYPTFASDIRFLV